MSIINPAGFIADVLDGAGRMANLSLAEGEYADFFDQYKAAVDYAQSPGMFAPNPVWSLFNGSVQIKNELTISSVLTNALPK